MERAGDACGAQKKEFALPVMTCAGACCDRRAQPRISWPATGPVMCLSAHFRGLGAVHSFCRKACRYSYEQKFVDGLVACHSEKIT